MHSGVHILTGSLWISHVTSHALRQWNVGVLRYRVNKKGNRCVKCTNIYVLKKNRTIHLKCENQLSRFFFFSGQNSVSEVFRGCTPVTALEGARVVFRLVTEMQLCDKMAIMFTQLFGTLLCIVFLPKCCLKKCSIQFLQEILQLQTPSVLEKIKSAATVAT